MCVQLILNNNDDTLFHCSSSYITLYNILGCFKKFFFLLELLEFLFNFFLKFLQQNYRVQHSLQFGFAVFFFFLLQKEYRKDLEEGVKGKGLTALEETPDMLRAKNATQILNEVCPKAI